MRYVNLCAVLVLLALFCVTDPWSQLGAWLAVGAVVNLAAYLAQTPVDESYE